MPLGKVDKANERDRPLQTVESSVVSFLYVQRFLRDPAVGTVWVLSLSV